MNIGGSFPEVRYLGSENDTEVKNERSFTSALWCAQGQLYLKNYFRFNSIQFSMHL
jgi:hypothetical protein